MIIVMYKLKFFLAIFALSALAAALVSCACSNTNKLENNLEVTQSAQMVDEYIPNLDSTGFALNIGAIDVDPAQWKYIGSKPAIIEFYADWCEFCKEQHPIFESVWKHHKSTINFYRINIEEQTMLANLFNIEAVPTLIYIAQDGTMREVQGLQTKTEIETTATALFANPPKDTTPKTGDHSTLKK